MRKSSSSKNHSNASWSSFDVQLSDSFEHDGGPGHGPSVPAADAEPGANSEKPIVATVAAVAAARKAVVWVVRLRIVGSFFLLPGFPGLH